MKKLISFLKKINEEIDNTDIDTTKLDNSELKDIADKTGVSEEDLQKQLEKGTKVEKEHKDLWDKIKDLVKDEFTEDDLYSSIALAHIKEIPDYYDLLDKMEKDAKKGKEEPTTESIKEGKCPADGCVKKVDNKWRIISNKTGKLWPQKYESKEKAEKALKAYQSNK